ncbi:Uncharacterised protein [Chlamydia abortus]|nr:Uncharacterised protein [Chlamydia abortus]
MSLNKNEIAASEDASIIFERISVSAKVNFEST